MTRRGKRAQAEAAVSSSQGETVYDRHCARLYQQALLTLGDAALAERVVGEVMTGECLRSSPPDADVAEYRLVVSVRRRCQELAADPAWWNRLPGPLWPEGMTGCLPPDGLTVRERGALALVIFGGLGYAEAADEMSISPPEMAALLTAVLHKLAVADAPV